jgi:ABC-2 type transport system ATP-binding protein
MTRRASTLSISNISKRFGEVDAIVDATMSVSAGEVIGFVGPNGAGKTTTISILMGFLKADKGSVQLLGKSVTPQTAHTLHRHIGYVAGDMVLPSTLSGQQFLAFCAARNGRNTQQYTRLLKQLHPVLDRPIGTLSRGNKQKIALIAALQHDPEILILDEPTSGLDPLMQDTFLSTVRTEANKGVTVLMSSHILSEVTSICSRIVFMKAGRFIVDKPIIDITQKLGKHVVVASPEASSLAKYLPPHAELLERRGNRLRLSVAPEHIKSFIQWLATKQFTDLTIEERELDDLFHELYADKKGGAS